MLGRCYSASGNNNMRGCSLGVREFLCDFHSLYARVLLRCHRAMRTRLPVAGSGLRSPEHYVPIAACVASCRCSLLRLFRANVCSRGVFASAGSWFSPPPLVALISCCVRHCWGRCCRSSSTWNAEGACTYAQVQTRQHTRRGKCYRCTP